MVHKANFFPIAYKNVWRKCLFLQKKRNFAAANHKTNIFNCKWTTITRIK